MSLSWRTLAWYGAALGAVWQNGQIVVNGAPTYQVKTGGSGH